MTVTVDATTTHQGIDGFGVSQYQPIKYDSGYSAVADALFSQYAGIGLSIYNMSIMADGSGNGQVLYQTTAFNGTAVVGDFSQELAAYNRGVRTFIARCWTFQPDPGPYTWQVSGSATGALIASDYATAATCWTTFLSNALAAGLPITHVSQQNEPDFTPSTYGQISWTTAQSLSFIKNNFGPAIATWGPANTSWQNLTGMTTPAIIWGETAFWSNFSSWVNAAETDSTALGYVSIYATHQYNGGGASSPPNPISRRIWQSECSTQGQSWDATMTDAMTLMGYVNSALTIGNANAWMFWMTEYLHDPDNQGLIGNNVTPVDVAHWNAPTYPKRFYCMGNFSKFVRPGSIRIDVTGAPGGVNILAFLSPQGNFVIVCINTNASSTGVTFSLKGGLTQVTMTPWITDASNNLVPQSAITVSNGSFSSTLTATSVTTFVGVQTTVVLHPVVMGRGMSV